MINRNLPHLFKDAVLSFRTVSLLVLSFLAEFRVLLALLAVMLLAVMSGFFVLLLLLALRLIVFSLVFLFIMMTLFALVELVEYLVTLFFRSR